MNKQDKLKTLFDFTNKNILLSDYLSKREVRELFMRYLSASSEKEMLDKLDIDFYYLSFRDLSQNETCFPYYKGPELFINKTERVCPFGITWKRDVRDDKFAVDEATRGPFTELDVTEKDILAHNWPKPEWFDFSLLAKECDEFSDKIIVGGLWSGIHGDSNRMMRYENFLLNIAMNKPLIKVLVDRMTQFYLEANRQYFEAVKGKMDIFFMGNDFGAQNGLLISEEDWEELYYDNFKKLIDLAHSYGFKVMMHSCGGIDPLLPRFIELGVDMIDPVQTTAKGMEPENLSKKYGDKLVFHGGLDTQNIFPNGTQNEVEEHCTNLVSKLNTNGNLVICPSNNFMPGTPLENIERAYMVINKLKHHMSKSNYEKRCN